MADNEEGGGTMKKARHEEIISWELKTTKRALRTKNPIRRIVDKIQSGLFNCAHFIRQSRFTLNLSKTKDGQGDDSIIAR